MGSQGGLTSDEGWRVVLVGEVVEGTRKGEEGRRGLVFLSDEIEEVHRGDGGR